MIITKLFSSNAGKWLTNSYRKSVFPTVRSMSIQPVNMSYRITESAKTDNSKTPLIIMHGLLGSKQNWRNASMALEDQLHCRIYTVDARNHGDSPHTDEHSTSHMAVDVAHFMETLGISIANVMGHSMGGRTMMHLALAFPHLVNKLIILDISPLATPGRRDDLLQVFQTMQRISLPTNLSRAEGRAAAGQELRKVADESTVNFLLVNLDKRETGEFYWKPNISVLFSNLRDIGKFILGTESAPPYQGKTLFICGSRSNYVQKDSWPHIQKHFPNSELRWLDTGHLVHFEKPKEFRDLVVDFLK